MEVVARDGVAFRGHDMIVFSPSFVLCVEGLNAVWV